VKAVVILSVQITEDHVHRVTILTFGFQWRLTDARRYIVPEYSVHIRTNVPAAPKEGEMKTAI
jgi:hypothetical protein